MTNGRRRSFNYMCFKAARLKEHRMSVSKDLENMEISEEDDSNR